MMMQTKAEPVGTSLDWVLYTWLWAVTSAIFHQSDEAKLGKKRQGDKSPELVTSCWILRPEQVLL